MSNPVTSSGRERVYLHTLMAVACLFSFGLSPRVTHADSPAVVDTEPDSAASSIALDLDSITVTFNVSMNGETINNETFTVTGTKSGAIEADSIRYRDQPKRAAFYIPDSLVCTERVNIVLWPGIQSATGDYLYPPNGYQFNFMTELCPDSCDTVWSTGSNFENIRIFAEDNADQTEVSLGIDPGDSQNLLIGSNWNRLNKEHQASYFSDDGDSTWTRDTVHSSALSSTNSRDPAVAFDTDGNAYFSFFTQGSESGSEATLKVSTMPAGSNVWDDPAKIGPQTGIDKPYLTVDRSPNSDYIDAIYLAWTEFGESTPIAFARSTDGGDLFTDFDTISDSIEDPGGTNLGVNLAVDPDGNLYAVWAIHDDGDNEPPNAIGFNKSVNGGLDWSGATRIVDDMDGVNGLKDKDFNAKTWPVMAIDSVGNIYVVWDERNASDYSDVFLMKSTNGGSTWGDPVKVNDNTSNTDQFFPWVAVDSYGGVDVAFLDCRGDPGNNYRIELWAARSTDGGQTFVNFPVSGVAFPPCSVPDRQGYIGEYISLAAAEDRLYACWSDNRIRPEGYERGIYQVFAASIPLEVSGTITRDTYLWSNVISGDLTVDAGATLTIKSGSEITVRNVDSDPVEILVKGTLALEEGTRVVFATDSSTSGDWTGIVIDSGGSVDWGDGCLISDAVVGVTVEADADTMTIAGVRIENCDSAGFVLKKGVSLVNDTIVGAGTIGIYVDVCDPDIDDVYIEDCNTGVWAKGSSGTLSDSKIYGPGTRGIYVVSSGGGDTLTISGTAVQYRPSDSARFTDANLRCSSGGHADIDDCEFISDTTFGNRTTYGVYADENAWVRVRNTKIHYFGSYGFYSWASKADLGTLTDSGFNSIKTPLSSTIRAYHTLVRAPGSGNMQARGNWWGTSSPDSAWFTNTDFTPYLTSDPLARMFMPSAIAHEAALPERFTLRQNYPNPFNAGTIIEFHLPAAAHARVEIFNILGQKVSDLIDRDLAAGRHQVTWNGTNERGSIVPSGVYLYRITAGDFIETKKMVLLK